MDVAMGAVLPLVGKIGKLISEEYNLEKSLKKDLMSTKRELEFMYATLEKLAEKPFDNQQVLVWAGLVREQCYDMEDAVEGFKVQLDDDLDCDPSNIKGRVKKLLKKTTRLFTKGKAIHQISNAIQEVHDCANQLYELRKRYC